MNLKNIEKCTLIEILKYFEDIIGDEGYNVLLNAISSDLDWNEELFKKSYSIAANETKRKLVRQIYARYYDELSKPKNKNKMQVLEKMILEDKKCETLTCNIDGVIKHYILTGQPQKSVDSIKNSETRETVITSIDSLSMIDNIMEITKDLIVGNGIIKKCLIGFLNDMGMKTEDIEKILNNTVYSVLNLQGLCDEINKLYKINMDTDKVGEEIKKDIRISSILKDMYGLDEEKTEKIIIKNIYEAVDVKELKKILKDDSKILEVCNKFIGNDAETQNSVDTIEAFNLYISEFLKSNLQLIDIDYLLQCTATRLIVGIKMNNGEDMEDMYMRTEIEEDEEQVVLRNSINFLRKLYKELEMRPASRSMKYGIRNDKNGDEIIVVTMEYIKKFLQKCTQDKYYSDEDIKQIHNEIKQGILPEDIEVKRIANINIEDLVNASKSYEEINDDADKKSKILLCGIEILKYLKETKAITDEQLLDLYINGNLNIEILDSIDLQEIVEEDYIEKFKTIYEATKQEDEEDINKKKFIRYSELYKRMISANKLKKDNLVMNLLEEYGEDSGNEILINLYNLGMVNLEDCINWYGTDILTDLFKMENRNIQPNQINNLYHKNMLSLNEIAKLIVMIPNIEERYITIASIFPEISESEERQELMYKTIKVDKALNKRSQTENEQIPTPVIQNDYNKHITDSTYRFNLIRLFDKDYFMEMTADGHAIIKLPKFKKVMIEKMLDTKKEEGYGAATYILDEDYYIQNEEEIRVDGKINRKELIRALKIDKADRFSHIVNGGSEEQKRKRTTWGEQLKRYFTELSNSKYTEDVEKEIDNAIENIENSMRTIGVIK